VIVARIHGFLRVVVPLMMGRALVGGNAYCDVRGMAAFFAGDGN